MLFIQYPPCSTCQKAKKWLDAHGLSYTERHIKEDNPTYEELKVWWERSGMPLKKFFNTSVLLYKSMQLKEKLPTMTDEEQLLIYRHYYAGISGTDLAEIYGVSQQAISKRIAKIRAKLKNLLEN